MAKSNLQISDPDFVPVTVEGEMRPSRWVISVDHASNAVPPCVNGGDLQIAPEDMARHIAYDVGALGVARHLGVLMDAPVVASTFSRLVIDPNRGEDDPTLVMKLYDGTIIPTNRHVDEVEVERRLAKFHRPYHNALAQVIAARSNPVLLAVHSFTPQFRGRALRPWQVGVLYAQETRLAAPLLDLLRGEADLCVGDNQPYSGALGGDAMDRHGLQTGRPHVLIELRNDLIERPEDQKAWAVRLAPLLDQALRDAQV